MRHDRGEPHGLWRGGAGRIGSGAAGAFVAALLIRIACAWLLGAAQPQEVRYVTIAENILSGRGFVGLDARFPDIIQPPLYPLLLAASFVLPADPLALARGVSLLMGALLVFPVAALGTRLFGPRAGRRSAWLVAFHPLLAHVSASALTESTFALLVAVAILLVWRLADEAVAPRGRPGPRYLLAGILVGLSYLTRPEGVSYLAAACLATLALQALAKSRPAIVAGSVALILLGFTLVAAPYVGWVHARTGQWLLAPKAVLSQVHRQLAEKGVREGWPEAPDSPRAMERAKFSLTEDGTELESFVAFHSVRVGFAEGLLVSESDGAPMSSPGSALRIVFKNIEVLYLDTMKHGYVIPPIVLLLGAAGLVAHPWIGAFRRHVLLLLVFFAASFSFILAPLQARFLCVAVLLTLPWAAEGWLIVEAWIVQAVRGAASRVRLAKAAAGGFAMIVIALTVLHLSSVIVSSSRLWAEHREMGLKLRASADAPLRVMAATPVVAYYAGAGFEVLPYAELPRVLEYARRRQVDYLVVQRHEILSLRPQLTSLLEPDVPQEGLELVESLHADTPEGLHLYRVKR